MTPNQQKHMPLLKIIEKCYNSKRQHLCVRMPLSRIKKKCYTSRKQHLRVHMPLSRVIEKCYTSRKQRLHVRMPLSRVIKKCYTSRKQRLHVRMPLLMKVEKCQKCQCQGEGIIWRTSQLVYKDDKPQQTIRNRMTKETSCILSLTNLGGSDLRKMCSKMYHEL